MKAASRGVIVIVGLAVVLAACSSKSDPAPPRGHDVGNDAGLPSPTPSPTGDTAAGTDPAAVIGAFDIRLVAADPGSKTSPPNPAHVVVQGQVMSGLRPPQLTLEETAREGACFIEVPSAPFCDPACRLGEVCLKGGKCVTQPMPRNVGDVSVTGLATMPANAPISMSPSPPLFYYVFAGDTKIAVPPFTEGDPIGLSAKGADFPAFQIASRGISMLEVTSPTPITMERGKPMALRWKAATMAGNSRVGIVVDISHHGGFKGQISCDVPDNGSFDLPAGLVGKLMDLGIAGYPTTTVTRRTTATAQLPAGRVELNVVSEKILAIVIPGFVSCGDDEPCPGGKVCGQDGLCK